MYNLYNAEVLRKLMHTSVQIAMGRGVLIFLITECNSSMSLVYQRFLEYVNLTCFKIYLSFQFSRWRILEYISKCRI